MAESRNEEIDCLRAIAIFLVVVYHLQLTALKGVLLPAYSNGWSGVDLFFVISGFLVSRSLASWLEPLKEEKFMGRALVAKNYMLRRFVRILPIAWLWALIPVALSLYLNESGLLGEPKMVYQEACAVVRFSYNYFISGFGGGKIGQFWSLAVEEHFYIFLPSYFLLVRRRLWRACGLLALFLAAASYRYYQFYLGADSVWSYLFHTHYRLDGLALGSVLGISMDIYTPAILSLAQRPISRVALRALGFFALLTIWLFPGFFGLLSIPLGFSLLALASCVLVGLASMEKNLTPMPLLGKRFMVWVGRRSYSIYLIHFPLLLLLQESRFRIFGQYTEWAGVSEAIAGIALYFLALGIITEMNFRLVEAPLMDMAKKSFPRRS